MAVNFNLDLLYQLYRHDSAKGGTKGGLIDAENFNKEAYVVNGSQIIITEADGDIFTYDLNLLTQSTNPATLDMFLGSENPVGTVTTPTTTQDDSAIPAPVGANDSSGTRETGTRTQAEIQEELDRLKERREALEREIEENNGKIADYKEKIDALYADIESTIGDYIDQAEDIAEDIKERVKEATQKHIEKYKNGEYDSTKSLHNALAAELEGILSASAMEHIMSELERVLSDKKAEIEPYIAEIETIEGENEVIEQEVETIQQEEEQLEAEKLTAPEEKTCDPPPTEPQGFAIKGADGSKTQFDFFVDRDGNGGLTDASEFLGAQGFEQGGKEGAWAEMTSLDTNGDGSVDIKELDAGGIQVVKTTTDANGNRIQESMSASEAFGKDSDIKISTTQHDYLSTSDIPEGFNQFANNTLLGNFDVTMNGETYTGYQTADSMDYLNASYNFTSGSAEGQAAQGGAVSGTFNTEQDFKYDIQAVVNKADVSESKDDLMAYAEELCRKAGITFSDSDKDEKMIIEELLKEQDGYQKFDFAA